MIDLAPVNGLPRATVIARALQLVKRTLILLGAAACMLASTPSARADDTPGISPPATFNLIDSNGVNLQTGSLSYSVPSISIGPANAGGLSYSRWFDTGLSPVGEVRWRDNFENKITRTNFSNPLNMSEHTYVFTVPILGRSVSFIYTNNAAVPPVGANFVPAEGDVATLEKTSTAYIFTDADGTVATFDKTYSPNPDTELSSEYLSTIKYPNGVTLKFTYVSPPGCTGYCAWRVQSINSNLGYQLHFEYQSNASPTGWLTLTKAVAVNNAVEYCAPAAYTCSFTQTWPTLTFTKTSSEETVTDSLGRVTRLGFNSDGLLTSITKPGGATVTVTYRYFLANRSIATLSNGASTWTYTYTHNDTMGTGNPTQINTSATDGTGSVSAMFIRMGGIDTWEYRTWRPARLTQNVRTTKHNYMLIH